ncbi:hypothetical protein Rsub_09093 [Raphidocelis subcapitata]|uniref:Uncharacterized protein n=1 Tax=Raphidocelis subcapitata TaxID=307507 RepID=A0A2V0P8W4_9CHLO|nr:hypothetical protein Rsub_09093 [Raphidocelis subcapitata]|eukprot:GBF96298.1 hypothetical protein Rsub_09093 [Raphidocelis subcapitata]
MGPRTSDDGSQQSSWGTSARPPTVQSFSPSGEDSDSWEPYDDSNTAAPRLGRKRAPYGRAARAQKRRARSPSPPPRPEQPADGQQQGPRCVVYHRLPGTSLYMNSHQMAIAPAAGAAAAVRVSAAAAAAVAAAAAAAGRLEAAGGDEDESCSDSSGAVVGGGGRRRRAWASPAAPESGCCCAPAPTRAPAPPLWRDASIGSSLSRCCAASASAAAAAAPDTGAAPGARRARFADEAAFRAALRLGTAEASLYVEWALQVME